MILKGIVAIGYRCESYRNPAKSETKSAELSFALVSARPKVPEFSKLFVCFVRWRLQKSGAVPNLS